MGATSKISWTDATFNPFIGCQHATYTGADGKEHAHQGCLHCYAEADMDKRRKRVTWGGEQDGGTRSRTSAAYWRDPIKWNKAAQAAGVRRKVFCASLADVFEAWSGPILDHNGERCCYEPKQGWLTQPASIEQPPAGARFATMTDIRRDLFRLIDATPWLDWLLLTKRPQHVEAMWGLPEDEGTGFHAIPPGGTRPLKHRANVWFLISASEQATYEWAVPWLARLRHIAPVTGISAEPLLGPLNLNLLGVLPFDICPQMTWVYQVVNWIITGGESGSERPCNVDWLQDVIDQCRGLPVKVFTKQLGSYATHGGGERFPGVTGKGADPLQWPLSLRVQEFPE